MLWHCERQRQHPLVFFAPLAPLAKPGKRGKQRGKWGSARQVGKWGNFGGVVGQAGQSGKWGKWGNRGKWGKWHIVLVSASRPGPTHTEPQALPLKRQCRFDVSRCTQVPPGGSCEARSWRLQVVVMGFWVCHSQSRCVQRL